MSMAGRLRLEVVSLKIPPPVPEEPEGCDCEVLPVTCPVPFKVRLVALLFPAATHSPPPGPLAVLLEIMGLLPVTVPPLVWRMLMPPPLAPGGGLTVVGSVVLPVMVQLFNTTLSTSAKQLSPPPFCWALLLEMVQLLNVTVPWLDPALGAPLSRSEEHTS